MTSLLETRRAFVIVFALGLFALAARGMRDPDLWWHLRTGELIAHTHHVPHADPFSFTRAGQPWVNHEWLSDVLIYGIYRVAGFGGLIVAFAGLITATFLILLWRSPGRPFVAALAVIWGAYASAPAWGVRPQIFSFFLASLALLILERAESRPNIAWWLVPITLVWVNLHAGYLLAIGLLLLFLLGGALDVTFGVRTWQETHPARRNLAWVLVACLAAVPLNPNGARMYWYPLMTLHSAAMRNYIAEWSSPDFHQARFLPFLSLILALLIASAFSERARRPRDLLLALATLSMALISVRHIPLFVLVAVPLVSSAAYAWFEGRPRSRSLTRPNRPWKAMNLAILVAALVFVTLKVRSVVRTQPQTEAQYFPANAVAFVLREHPPGPILNHYNWGGYFIWRLYPEYRVFIDGRADVYGDASLDDFAGIYYVSSPQWRALLEKSGVRTVILPPSAPLVSELLLTSTWTKPYADSKAVILTRTAPPPPTR